MLSSNQDLLESDDCFVDSATDAEDASSLVSTSETSDKSRKYNTTSTVFVANTISNPNPDEIFLCLASVLQSQICEDDQTESQNANQNFRVFDLIPELSPLFGGPAEGNTMEVLPGEAVGDEVLRSKIISGTVPSIDTIFRYLNLIYRAARYSPECNIMALIYMNRITLNNGMPLTMKNWRSVWLVCVMLAQKVWDDKSLKTSSFSTILPSFSTSDLRGMEAKALDLLKYSVGVKPSLYAKYYFELRQLFAEISGTSAEDWSLKPLTKLQWLRLEVRSALADKRAQTFEDVTRKASTPYLINLCP